MIYENDINTTVEYRGKALGNFPKNVNYVLVFLFAITDEIAWIKTSEEMTFGVLSKDCYPHWIIDTEPAPNWNDDSNYPEWSLSVYDDPLKTKWIK